MTKHDGNKAQRLEGYSSHMNTQYVKIARAHTEALQDFEDHSMPTFLCGVYRVSAEKNTARVKIL